MRNKTQERIEELARERAATLIDLALVEDGIEFGKRMMAEMMATYTGPGASASGPGAAHASTAPSPAASGTPAQEAAGAAGGGYLNEVRSR
jgi:hypothetical protein